MSETDVRTPRRSALALTPPFAHRLGWTPARYAVVALGALITVYPLVWLFGSSLKTNEAIFSDYGLIPVEPQWRNYQDGWNGSGISFGRFLANSVFVAGMAALGTSLSAPAAAYAIRRLRFRGNRLVLVLVLGTIVVPRHVMLIPEYVIWSKLGQLDSFVPLIVPKFLALDGFFVFLFYQFIAGIPKELDEAAHVDGCSPIGVYWRVIFPLLSPAIVTSALLTFIFTYQDFFSQLIYLNTPEKFTVPLGLQLFLDSTTVAQWAPLLAMSVLAMFPIMTIFFLFQRRILEGVAASGLKG